MTETVILALIALGTVCILFLGVYMIARLVLRNDPTKLSITTKYVTIETEFKKSR